jgi:hypothetical protein
MQCNRGKSRPVTSHEGTERERERERESRGMALFNLNFGVRWDGVVNAILWPFYLRNRNTVPTVEEAG